MVDAPEQGVRADLTFVRRSPAVEEPHFFQRAGSAVFFDYTRLTQFGDWPGGSSSTASAIDLAADRDVGAPRPLVGRAPRRRGGRARRTGRRGRSSSGCGRR